MKVFNRPIKLGGHDRIINSVDMRVQEYDVDGNVMRATGTTVPTADSSGFAKGALFIKTDAADGTKGLYENAGTALLSDFNVIGDITSAEIAADAVSLEHLDSGIEPSHVVKYAGEVTWSGGGATLASTVTGVLATDIVVASFHTKGTQGTILQGAAASADTITFTLDVANTSNDAVISYVVYRAAV